MQEKLTQHYKSTNFQKQKHEETQPDKGKNYVKKALKDCLGDKKGDLTKWMYSWICRPNIV